MDKSRWQKVEDLFAQASELPESKSLEFLDRTCGTDESLHAELRSLLDAHRITTGPLDAPPNVGADELESLEVLEVGTRLGAWSLSALIGHGGSGEIYLATRADGAFRQQVAVKVLRREAASQVQRFNAERQILARLDDPGLARLLDGGLTPDGRPYAVVEYVEGVSLIEHCRACKADLQERLSLFAQVCDVVAYAHRNLIVHRDLKPGNILVTAQGRVKLLDFGIAKQLDVVALPSDDRTSAPFTPDYAAPEQLTGDPVSTATDVYALGVLLFELLTDRRPWTNAGQPFARSVQLIVDSVAPAPSRIASSAASPPIAPSLLEGDLDAIVAKCLRKEPDHRYATVNDLRRDLDRYQQHAPISAREGARLYVMGRLLRRHRWAVGGGFALFVSLTVGLAIAIVLGHRASVERDIARRAEAREEAVRYYLTSMFRDSAAGRGGEVTSAKDMLDATARHVLSAYRDEPLLAGKVVATLSDLYSALEDMEGQVPLLEGFLDAAGPEADPESVAFARQKLANVELMRGHADRAAMLLPQAEQFWATAPERYREQHLEAKFVRGLLQRAQGDLDGAIRTYEATIEERKAFSGEVHRETANLYNSLAISLTAANRFEEALAAYHTTLNIQQKLGHANDLDALVMLGNTGTLAFRVGRLAEAETILKNAYTKQLARAGDSAAVAAAMSQYGAVQTTYGRYFEAEAILNDAIAMAAKFAGPTGPLVIQGRLFLTEALIGSDNLDAARKLADENAAVAHERFGDQHLLTLRAMLEQSRVTLAGGHAEEASRKFELLLPALRKLGPTASVALGNALLGAGESQLALSHAPQASKLFDEAVQLRAKQLWDQSWELAEARARLGEARARVGDTAGLAILRQAAATLQAQLGAVHPQVLRAKRSLAELSKT